MPVNIAEEIAIRIGRHRNTKFGSIAKHIDEAHTAISIAKDAGFPLNRSGAIDDFVDAYFAGEFSAGERP